MLPRAARGGGYSSERGECGCAPLGRWPLVGRCRPGAGTRGISFVVHVPECCVWCGVVHVRPHKRTLNHASATCIARSGLDPACLPRRLSRRGLAAAPAAPPRSSRHCFSLGVSWLGRDRQLCMVAYGSRHSWAGARATCSASGGRLCSPHELRSQPEGGGVRGSGAASRCARQGQWELRVDFRAVRLLLDALPSPLPGGYGRARPSKLPIIADDNLKRPGAWDSGTWCCTSRAALRARARTSRRPPPAAPTATATARQPPGPPPPCPPPGTAVQLQRGERGAAAWPPATTFL